MNKQDQDFKEFLISHPEYLVGDRAGLAAATGLTLDQAAGRLRRLRANDAEIKALYAEIKDKGLDVKDPEQVVLPKHDIAILKARQDASEIARKYNILLKDYQEQGSAYDALLAIKNSSYNEDAIIPGNPELRSEATAIVMWSDWHVAERVELGVSMGLNKTTPEIMKTRSQTLARNTIRLVTKERNDVTIDNLLLHLGGDFINAFLHDHDIQNNYMSPIEESLFAKDLLIAGIQYLLDYGDFKKITVVCNRGNHPRLTKKMSSSTDYKMSFETMIYSNVSEHFASDSRIEFFVPDSEIGYVKVYDKTVRYFHGHQVHYMGGVGGMTIPLNRLMMRWDFNRRADLNLMGHFHQYSMPNGNTLLNGSMVGFNAYANSLGFPYEPPLQTFQLLDKKRGFTTRMPIFCE